MLITAQAESTAPDLIGVQRAALWQTGTPSATFPPPPATTVAYNFVKILVDAHRPSSEGTFRIDTPARNLYSTVDRGLAEEAQARPDRGPGTAEH
jgi:hypothetical protein